MRRIEVGLGKALGVLLWRQSEIGRDLLRQSGRMGARLFGGGAAFKGGKVRLARGGRCPISFRGTLEGRATGRHYSFRTRDGTRATHFANARVALSTPN